MGRMRAMISKMRSPLGCLELPPQCRKDSRDRGLIQETDEYRYLKRSKDEEQFPSGGTRKLVDNIAILEDRKSGGKEDERCGRVD